LTAGRRRAGGRSTVDAKEMVRPVYESPVSGLYIRSQQFGSIAGRTIPRKGEQAPMTRVTNLLLPAVRARKLYSAGNGEETEAPLDQPIDVGMFAANPDARAFNDKGVIALEKQPIKSGDQTIEYVVDRKPVFVGVDPISS
jgi:hypothetical protein